MPVARPRHGDRRRPQGLRAHALRTRDEEACLSMVKGRFWVPKLSSKAFLLNTQNEPEQTLLLGAAARMQTCHSSVQGPA